MKKIYSKPSMKVIKLQHSGIICQSVTGTEGPFGYGGGGNGPARARQRGGWDDDWDDWE